MRHLTPRLPMVLLAALTCLLAFVGQAVERELHAEDAKAVLPDGTSGTQTTTATPDTQQVPVLTPWRMFRHDARHTGCSPFIGAQTSTIKWSYPADTRPYPVAVNSSPAIARDGTIYIGSLNNAIHALNPDGTLKWSYMTGDFVDSSPAIGRDGTVYVAAYDSFLYALNPDGTLKWRYQIGQTDNSPTVGRDDTIYIGSSDGLYALNPDDSLQWRYTTQGSINSSPAVARDGTVYIGTDGGCIDEPLICFPSFFYALNPDGTLKWRFWTGYTETSSPAVAWDGSVYFGTTQGYLYALTASGRLKWRYQAEGFHLYSSPAIGWDGTIYFSAGFYVYALNSDGTLKWKSLESLGAFFGSSPAVGQDGSVYIGSDYDFYAFNSDGSLKWSYHKVSGFYSSPAIGQDGTVYVKSGVSGEVGVGYLYAFGPGPALANDGMDDLHHDLPWGHGAANEVALGNWRN